MGNGFAYYLMVNTSYKRARVVDLGCGMMDGWMDGDMFGVLGMKLE